MVGMVTHMAESNRSRPRPIFAVEYDPGGSTLQLAASDPEVRQLVRAAHWNVVVLQEQSQRPSLPYWLINTSLPALTALVHDIRAVGATPLLFETWGYRVGDLGNYPSDNYDAMQARLYAGYTQMGSSTRTAVAPVGDAWALALREDSSADLWASDGHHPSVEGSYLTAAVLTSMIDAEAPRTRPVADPQNTDYAAGLDPRTAAWLRRVAATAVMRSPLP